MKIREIHVRKENLQLTRPYSIAYKTVDAVDNCVVEVVTDSGLYGLGASNPSKQVVGKDVDDTLNILTEENLSWLYGRDIREAFQLCHEVREKFAEQPGACAALDIALHDVLTKHLQVPLVRFLGQKHKTLPTSITIGIKSPDATLEEAKEYVERGFKSIKVKLGKSLEEDMERLRKLKEAFKNEVLIRVDANQGYSRLQLEDFYHTTLSMDLELIEQPLVASAIEDYKKLPTAIKKVVAMDESLVSPRHAFLLASHPAAGGIFNIKLMKCGGIQAALEIAVIAKHAEIDLMWGCNDESIVSIAAALHTAFSCQNTKYIDLDGSFDLAKDVASGGFILKDGMMSVVDKPGLGVERL